ncbi:MAG: GNAT family N-acetyltransferase, partial [Myxococcales bacterium]|nr:GNAT family N-acetyltransferase [Myxococcales bacterium]
MVRLPVRRTDRLGQPYTVRSYRPEDRAALEAMYDAFEPKRIAQGLPPAREEQRRRWLDRVLGVGI